MTVVAVLALSDLGALGVSALLTALVLGPPLALVVCWQLAADDTSLERACHDVARYVALKERADRELAASVDYFAPKGIDRATQQVSRYIALKEQADHALYPRRYRDSSGI